MSKDDKVVRTYTYYRKGVTLVTNSLSLALNRNDGENPVTYVEKTYEK